MHPCILCVDCVIILDKNVEASQISMLEILSNFQLLDQLVDWKREDRPKVYSKLRNTTVLKVWGKLSTAMYLYIRDVYVRLVRYSNPNNSIIGMSRTTWDWVCPA